MKSTLYIALATVMALSACKGKEEAISRSEIEAKVDSLVGSKMEEINRQAMEDLDRRMAIEVKAKADSIVAATLAQQAGK